jgi:ferric-dicitrate binding protein FerR (iron transport regulator)
MMVDDGETDAMLEAAAKQVEPPEGMRARVYANVLREFESPQGPSTIAPPRSRWMTGKRLTTLALAASLLVAMGVVFRAGIDDATPGGMETPIAVVVYGSAQTRSGALSTGQRIPFSSGSEITTASEPVHFRLSEKTGIRLGQDSAFKVEDATTFRLLAGVVYVDNEDPNRAFRIRSRVGTVTEIGTRYAVRLNQDDAEIAVRQGRISLRTPSGTVIESSAVRHTGELLRVAPNDRISREALSPADAWWHWTTSAAAPFTLPGASVHRYLEWICGEFGLNLVYQSDIVQVQARQTRLGGGGTVTVASGVDALIDQLAVTQYTGLLSGTTLTVDFRR